MCTPRIPFSGHSSELQPFSWCVLVATTRDASLVFGFSFVAPPRTEHRQSRLSFGKQLCCDCCDIPWNIDMNIPSVISFLCPNVSGECIGPARHPVVIQSPTVARHTLSVCDVLPLSALVPNCLLQSPSGMMVETEVTMPYGILISQWTSHLVPARRTKALCWNPGDW